MKLFRYLALIIYYGFAQFLPHSYTPVVGPIAKAIRGALCRIIFKQCGRNVNIERRAHFGSGFHITIGDNSGLGANCHVPNDTQIGHDVMMAENCYILARNHAYADTTIPMRLQGSVRKRTVIGNDVWIGRDVIMTPGRTICSGSIIAAGTVLTKDFPEYAIVGGNPGKLIKLRK
ncbi:MAG: acyltransferase [Bacteroidales bacterium]|nr:acyltransferase [Bacteroidales bacterium]